MMTVLNAIIIIIIIFTLIEFQKQCQYGLRPYHNLSGIERVLGVHFKVLTHFLLNSVHFLKCKIVYFWIVYWQQSGICVCSFCTSGFNMIACLFVLFLLDNLEATIWNIKCLSYHHSKCSTRKKKSAWQNEQMAFWPNCAAIISRKSMHRERWCVQ